MKVVLRAKNISKKYNGHIALKNMNFTLHEGEIHGLVGANGSGKSTFLKILFTSPIIKDTGGYEGEIELYGEKVEFHSTKDALDNGIGMVHQEFALLSELDIASNIKLQNENVNEFTEKILGEDFAYINIWKNQKDAKRLMNKMGVEIDPKEKAKALSMTLKQFVEIAREIDKKNLKVLLLDEPSAPLSNVDSNKLLKIIGRIASSGTAVILISHRLEEIKEICDKVTVLRDGEVVAHYDKKDSINIKKIALDMIGREVKQVSRVTNIKESKEKKEIILSFKDVQVKKGPWKNQKANLDIYHSEILGITGLAGQGQENFSYGLMGLYPMEGKVTFQDELLNVGNVHELIKKGIYILPDERKEMGLLLNSEIWENIVLNNSEQQKKFLKYPRLGTFSFLDNKKIKNHVQDMIKKLNIQAQSINQKVGQLSGGNQQKVCIARAITVNPSVLFVGEPTRGIDIFSKEIILKYILELKGKGITVIVSSSELSELKRIADRIAIMYEGKVFKILDPEASDVEYGLGFVGKEEVLCNER